MVGGSDPIFVVESRRVEGHIIADAAWEKGIVLRRQYIKPRWSIIHSNYILRDNIDKKYQL